MNKRIAVITVHPDDETLGCAGTILKHIGNADEVYWIIITDVTEKLWEKSKIKKREEEINIVAEMYGFKETIRLGFETTNLDTVPLGEITTAISGVFKRIKPNVIYAPNRSDIHSDHRVTFEAVMSSSKIFNHPYIDEILMYECISETEFAPALSENAFVPNYFVDITEYMDKKCAIMSVYASEIKQHPFPRSKRNIMALATFRGAQAGVEYAESFVILRNIWK